jgi:copper chaperone CopZ
MTITPSPTTTQTFDVIGMSCHHCEMAVTDELSKVPGVCSVDVDVSAGTVTVASERPLDRGTVAAAIDEAGYELA